MKQAKNLLSLAGRRFFSGFSLPRESSVSAILHDLSAITDAGLLRRIKKVIEQVEAARTFQQISNLKRLDAKGKHYRIRLGDYRIGFVFDQNTVCFVRCLHRKEIYRYFP